MTTKQTNTIEKELAAVEQIVKAQEKKIAELRKQLARGTRDDVRAEAEVARTTPVAEPTIAARIETALRVKPRSLVELSSLIGESTGRTIVLVRKLKANVYNLGTESSPRWYWRVGDEGPTTELSRAVEQLLHERPFTHQELIDATGARGNRISGVLYKLQVRGVKIRNLGSRAVARWFVAAPLSR